MEPTNEMGTWLSDFFGLEGGGWPERALLQIDRAAGTVVAVQPEPCDCQPAYGAALFPADAGDCQDTDKADAAVFRYDYLARDPAAVDALPPADLNNLACYLLWQSDATPESAKAAYDLLRRARDNVAHDDPLRPILDANIDKFRPIEPGVPRSLSLLQNVVYGSGQTMRSLEEWMIEKAD